MRIALPAEVNDATVDQISTPSLGNHTYLITVGDEAVVIDPQRDYERFDVCIPDGCRLVAVCETHVHNDYVSGGFWLARDHDAAYVLPEGSDASYDHTSAGPGTRLPVGDYWLEVVDTPGHTFHHSSYLLTGASGPIAVFSGGSMLVAAVGRSDLLGDAFTDELLHHQYRSVTNLANDLATNVIVAPTHGAGSFCSASAVSGTTSNIGAERNQNPVCMAPTVGDFVRAQKAGYGLYPTYYSHMAEVNLGQAPRLDLGDVPSLSATEAIESGSTIIDVRPFEQFADRHISGSIAAPISDQDATYVAWTVPWNSPLIVVGRTDDVAPFRMHLARLGWDNVKGVVSDTDVAALPDDQVSTTRIADFADLVASRPAHIVDVRDPVDHATGTISGAIPAHVSAVARDGVTVDGPDVWVHCAGGYRAMIATGFLERQGYSVTTVVDTAPANLSDLLS